MKTINRNQYNHIAEKYHQSTQERDDRRYVLDPSIEYYLGRDRSLVGAKVLDLGCGSGHYSRLVARRGARVVAVDESVREIAIARSVEAAERLGITYKVADACSLPFLGQFDLVLALFLLHYCQNKDDLLHLCEGIYKSLKPGGRFLCFNNNPMRPMQDCLENYGYAISGPQPLREGDVLTVRLQLKSGEVFSFEHYYWSREAYEAALVSAGFEKKSIRWRPLIVSQEGKEKFPAGFWDEYMANSNPVVLECVK